MCLTNTNSIKNHHNWHRIFGTLSGKCKISVTLQVIDQKSLRICSDCLEPFQVKWKKYRNVLLRFFLDLVNSDILSRYRS